MFKTVVQADKYALMIITARRNLQIVKRRQIHGDVFLDMRLTVSALLQDGAVEFQEHRAVAIQTGFVILRVLA
jgi:hypothetical protein